MGLGEILQEILAKHEILDSESKDISDEKAEEIMKEISEAYTDDHQEQKRKKPRKLPGNEVQLKLTSEEIKEKIQSTIVSTRRRVNQSNKTEFLAPRTDGAARTSEPNPDLDRKDQMKLGIVENKYGPLNRTNDHKNIEDEQEEQQLISNALNSANKHIGLEKRITTVEDHLGLKPTSQMADLYDRIRGIEDFLIEIEEHAPEIARRFFQAHHATANAQKGLIRHQSVVQDVKVVRAADGSDLSEDDGDSEEEELQDSEINNKINELKKSLLSNN